MSIVKFNNKIIKFNTKTVGWTSPPDPYNPLNLPANTIRVRTNDGNAPIKATYSTYETATLVSGTSDVYDVYKSGTSFGNLLYQSTNVIEVIGANTTDITDMSYMLFDCNSLTSINLFDTSKVTNMQSMFGWSSIITVPLFDTSKVTNISDMFNNCHSLQTIPLFNTVNVITMQSMFSNCFLLQSVPLFDTSKVTNMSEMLYYCQKVESGALALYQQASTQTNPPTDHSKTFYRCGKNTTQGAAELAQIPSDWK